MEAGLTERNINKVSRATEKLCWNFHIMQRYFIKITETVRCAAKVTSCAGSNPIKTICKYRFHYVRFVDNLSHLWNCLWEIKICLLHRDQSKRHIYLFLLSAQGHCFHGDSVMASFASLSFFFHSTPFISAIYLFEDPSWLLWRWLPPPHQLFFTFHPYLPLP